MLVEREAESCYLGQFIPLQYHHNMLMDANRMDNFKAAIQHQVFEGAKVLELGGGTGVLSWFAAQHAAKVYCVEFNPDMVAEARRLMGMNQHGERVEVIHADAFEYLPPEPVDFVICEMIHVAMLREKQVEVIENFKRRYAARFPDANMPVFIPEAILMAVQPLQQRYDFSGFQAPIIQFQLGGVFTADTQELAQPVLYKIIDFTQANDLFVNWAGQIKIEQSGRLSALRFITKNVLAIVPETNSTIDWLNHYMALPLKTPINVNAGDIIEVRFNYRTGGAIDSLQQTISVEVNPHLNKLERGRHLIEA
ncbi:methyltransferase domain-containing protein [Undibacterium fentianense]|uniref:Methyltransferase domain-containing protein n=1 Tax=Undibacterium fentianense TaxID=2828728 RepID=A0A941IE48_9BURK|nr:methyltransferase domain-containing protein [Undibacterium fentianense]MBR7799261.1 methyltransferase domain-containing protein [Undibacterium fentianense]